MKTMAPREHKRHQNAVHVIISSGGIFICPYPIGGVFTGSYPEQSEA
jgi:hypothetical protein